MIGAVAVATIISFTEIDIHVTKKFRIKYLEGSD
jgi:hypothetical protein